MKATISTLLTLLSILAYGQSLPIDFEQATGTGDFIDFDGGMAAVIDNPEPIGINTSSKVAQVIRNGGEVWAGSKILLESNLDFSTQSSISMKVFTSAPVGTTIKFKLEGEGATERDVQTTVRNQWEVLTWDFTGIPTQYTDIVFMFDFGNIGDGSANSTFLFDDIEQVYVGMQIDLPVDFEGSDINYLMSDFEGSQSMMTTDPMDVNNTVMQVTKPDGATASAGTTIGTPAGFANYIPLNDANSGMVVRVWSPQAGTPVRLKVEDANDPTHTCETETLTTVTADWEYVEFDFNNEAPGTELLSVGLSMGWKFNMASIFFDFGTDGVGDGDAVYYFDDVEFGFLIIATEELSDQQVRVYPNPTMQGWTVTSTVGAITSLVIYDTQGRAIQTLAPDQQTVYVDASYLQRGIYVAELTTATGTKTVRLLK